MGQLGGPQGSFRVTKIARSSALSSIRRSQLEPNTALRSLLSRPLARGAAATVPRCASAFGFPGELEPSSLIASRYQVEQVLGRGGGAVTYKCKDLHAGTEVAVKALSLRGLRNWKQLELFERESRVLEGLRHPGIPRHLNYFHEDSLDNRSFYLVQELGDGQSLADMVAGGWRGDESEVERIAVSVLEILEYLGDRRPPVIHRDIKPDNIVMEGGKSGGKVLLVDFGGVQGVASLGDRLGSTVIGTYGYMAPEQFRGSAQPASDLYSLGATLLFLLSGQPPSAFPQDRLRLKFDDVAMSPRLRRLLEALLQPLAEERLTTQQALALLRGREHAEGASPEERLNTQQALAHLWAQEPADGASPDDCEGASARGGLQALVGGRVRVSQQGGHLDIEFLPANFIGILRCIPIYALPWLFLAVSTLLDGPVYTSLFPALTFLLLSGGAWSQGLVRQRLHLGPTSWTFQQRWGLFRGSRLDWEAAAGPGEADERGVYKRLSMWVALGKPLFTFIHGPGLMLYIGGGLTEQVVDGDIPGLRAISNRETSLYALGAGGLSENELEWLKKRIDSHIAQAKQNLARTNEMT